MIVKNLKEWHKIVCESVNYVCQGCKKEFNYTCYFQGEVNQYVCGHHIKSQGANIILRLETDNGLCLCRSCHVKIHSSKI